MIIKTASNCYHRTPNYNCVTFFAALRLAKITQGFHGGPISPPNLFGNRDMTFVAVEKGVDGRAL